MKGIVFHEFQGVLKVEQLPMPKLKPDGVIIKVKATGLCRSDWHGWMGHDSDIQLPHVPGHEWAGIIASVGKNVSQFKIGDRVTAPFVCGCGTCPECHSGNEQVCDRQSQPGFTHWGSFAEYVGIDYADTNLVLLPDEIEFKTAAILGCRFITSFRAVVAQGKVKKNDFVAVHGCGGVGLSAIMIANAFGANTIAVDLNNEQLALAKTLGATHLVNPTEVNDVVKAIITQSNGGVQISIDALGSKQTSINSISNLRKRGKHIQVGLMTGDHSHLKIPMDRILAEELEILGSHGMQAHKYPQMLQMIKDGLLQPQKLLDNEISLEEACQILPQMNKFNHKGVVVITKF